MPKQKRLFLIELPRIVDDCLLSFAQTPNHIPFGIKRVYYITQANPKLPRGYHAHKKTKQVIFCIQGSIDLILNNGKSKSKITLDKSHIGVFIDKMIWHEMTKFKRDSIVLVLASEVFDEKDYIRNYAQFKKQAKT